tara:strand:- start:47 stop:562 length:516 start_codon:yes stop_codon:yes gene_type:complete
MEITKNMIEESWDLRPTIKDSHYIKLMDLLKDIYDYQSCSHEHKIKIYYETTIIVASEDWKQTHDQEYNEFQAQEDTQAEIITITTEKKFKILLNDKINFINNYDIESGWWIKKTLFHSLYSYDKDKKLKDPKLLMSHMDSCSDAITLNNLKNEIYYQTEIQKIISYVRFI